MRPQSKSERGQGRWGIAGLILGAALVVPAIVPTYIVHIAVFVLIDTLPVIGLGILSGYAGRVSLAQGALFGLGAYTTALLTTRLGTPPLAGLVAAILVAALAGVILGAPALRLAGLYFVMATIGIQQIIWIILMNWSPVTGGPQGVRSIPGLGIGAVTAESPQAFYYIALAMALASYLLSRRVLASRLGLQLRSLSDDELAASACAVSVVRAKVIALALSAAWAGAGGFLYAHYVRYIHPEMFTLEPSILFLTMSIFGGYRSLEGMLIATAILESATEYLRPLGEYRLIGYGFVLLLGMMYFPQGILSLFRRRRSTGKAEHGTSAGSRTDPAAQVH
jgi:branched-chain amino acid transport system permease protein